MDTLMAFAMGEATKNQEPMVFDWEKAAQIIKEWKPRYAAAGLRGDWEYTGGCIYDEGKPVENSYTYLASTWAVPELHIDDEVIPCYRMKSETPGWDADTKWPAIALAVLREV